MKHCKPCGTDKNTAEFNKDKYSGDGFQSRCKACQKAYKVKNKLRVQANNKAYKADNRSKIRIQNREWQQANPDKRDSYAKNWQQANLDRVNAISAKSRIAKKQGHALWADHDAISAFYTEAQRLTKLTGVSHHVDHIIPLQGENVSGLHVETNLQVIPYHENLSKSNKYEIGDIDV